jgi:predicted transcriptional regulator
VIKDILRTIQENHNSIKPTPLLRKSNLSTKRFSIYMRELLNKDFVKEMKNSDGKHFSITIKGHRYLEKYQNIVNFIEEFEL